MASARLFTDTFESPLSPAIAQLGETAWLNPSRQFAAVLRQPDTLGREHGELASLNVPSARHRPGQAASR